jgi:hypothetical protein
MQSRLTASKKKRRSQGDPLKTSTKPKPARWRPAVSRVECLDGLRDCLATIGALAGLLEAAGQHPRAELLEAGMVSHTGKLILAEVAKAEAWLDKLEEAAR